MKNALKKVVSKVSLKRRRSHSDATESSWQSSESLPTHFRQSSRKSTEQRLKEWYDTHPDPSDEVGPSVEGYTQGQTYQDHNAEAENERRATDVVFQSRRAFSLPQLQTDGMNDPESALHTGPGEGNLTIRLVDEAADEDVNDDGFGDELAPLSPSSSFAAQPSRMALVDPVSGLERHRHSRASSDRTLDPITEEASTQVRKGSYESAIESYTVMQGMDPNDGAPQEQQMHSTTPSYEVSENQFGIEPSEMVLPMRPRQNSSVRFQPPPDSLVTRAPGQRRHSLRSRPRSRSTGPVPQPQVYIPSVNERLNPTAGFHVPRQSSEPTPVGTFADDELQAGVSFDEHASPAEMGAVDDEAGGDSLLELMRRR